LSKLIDKYDLKFSHFIGSIHLTKDINRFLSKINRGETVALIFFPIAFYVHPWKEALWMLLFASVITYFNDRMVLFVKKLTSRKRPLVRVLEKVDTNPDMKHSFPSAHAANSMVFLCILWLGFSYPWYVIILSFLAGLGRLLTLHHFLSDVLAGWLIGFIIGFVSVQVILPIFLLL
jgi:membrane-associated phospholipid phosphatase